MNFDKMHKSSTTNAKWNVEQYKKIFFSACPPSTRVAHPPPSPRPTRTRLSFLSVRVRSHFSVEPQLISGIRNLCYGAVAQGKDRVDTLFSMMMDNKVIHFSRSAGLLSVRNERCVSTGNGMLPGRMLSHDLSRCECISVCYNTPRKLYLMT